MFKYISRKGNKITINPKMITVIMESDSKGFTSIYTCDSSEPIIVKEDYEKVTDEFENFMYTIQTIINVR